MSDKVNVCWLIGGYFQRKQLIKSIHESIANAATINVSEETSGEEVLSIIQRSDEGIFDTESSNKVIIIRSLPEFKKTKQPTKLWKSVLENCPSNIVVIFDNVNKSESPTLFKFVKKIGKVFECDVKISRSEAIETVEHFFEQEEKKITPENMAYLVDRVKDDKKLDADLIYSNLIKLLAYMGKSKEVTKEDITLTISNNTKFVIWDWFELMDKKDFHSLVVDINSIKNKEKLSNVVASSLPVIRWRYKLLLMVKEQQMIFKDSRKVIEELSSLKKKDKDGELKQAYSDYSIRGLLYGTASSTPPIDLYTRGQLMSILKLIDNFILKNRYGATECQSELMLEMLFMFICRHGDLSIIKDVRQYLIER